MPYHHVPTGTLHADIRAIEQEGEVVVQVVNDAENPNRVHVFTRWIGTELRYPANELRAGVR